MTTTHVLVRVQAKGGKFIGPDAGYSQVTLTDVSSGAILAQHVAQGGSGVLTGGFVPGATRQQIVTSMWGTQTTLWLSAPEGQPTAGITVDLELDAPTLVRFTAEALTDKKPNGHTVSQTMWLTPGADLLAEPGIVLVLPGLIVQDLAAAPLQGHPTSVTISAYVAMMCGCRIDPSLPWQPAEFAVTAGITDANGALVAQTPLACAGMSAFAAAGPVALPAAGTYTLTVNAVQPAEGNAGSASIPITVSA